MMKETGTIESRRLILRPWSPDDAEDLYAYAQSDLVGPNAGWRPHRSITESRATIENMLMKAGIFAITLKEGGEVIGSLGLHSSDISKRYPEVAALEVGYVLSPDYWGNGYMPEAVTAAADYAFQHYGLDGLYCCYFDFNYRSKRVIEKSGFQYSFEVTTTVPAFDNVQYNEIVNYITRDDFYGRNPDLTDFLRG